MPQDVDDEWWFLKLLQNQCGMYILSSLHGLDGTILWYVYWIDIDIDISIYSRTEVDSYMHTDVEGI